MFLPSTTQSQRGALHIAGLFFFIILVVAFIYLISVHVELRAIHHEMEQMHQEMRAGKGCGVS